MSAPKEWLQTLVCFEPGWRDALERLRDEPWDEEGEPILELRAELLRSALMRRLAGEISEDDLAEWAEALQMREDVVYEVGREELVGEVLFELSSPDLQGIPAKEQLRAWLRALD